MSGHSKWAQIKRKKATIDARRGKLFTKLIKEIAVAARLGGGDENANPRLRQAILAAKSANMPADNIKRAIQRGTGELPGAMYEEALFEGYGPGGVAIMIEAMTDNRKRTVAEIRHLMTKHGGNMGEPGCVAWMFDKQGLITVQKNDVDEEKLLETLLECGGEDFGEADDVYEITCSYEKLLSVRECLEARGFTIKSAELSMVPHNTVRVEKDSVEKVLSLMEALDDHDDIQNIHANFDIDNEALAEAE